MVVIKKISRFIIWFVAFLFLLAGLAIAAIQFIVFPNIDQRKDEIAAKVTGILGQKVTIGGISTGWEDISPQLVLSNIEVYDTENRSALHLDNVAATLSWFSIPLLEPRLARLVIHEPDLTIRRENDGTVYLAGISLSGPSKPDFANWLLKQNEIVIDNARIVWQDDLRRAPTLSLDKLNLKLENSVLRSLLGQHLFDLNAIASTGTRKAIHANGGFSGRDVSQLDAWHGNLYLQVDDADLTAFKPWVDYPIEVYSGSGDSKIWLDFANKHFSRIIANLALDQLSAKLSHAHEPFVADHFSGIVTWENKNQKSMLYAKNIRLESNRGFNIHSGSGHVILSEKNRKPWIDAAVKLDQFNLASTKQLEAIIPMPKDAVEKLNKLSPIGHLKNINISWVGDAESSDDYNIDFEFSGLGLSAVDHIPGFENLTGEVEADEDGGHIKLNANNAAIDLKEFFRWPMPANILKGEIVWKTNHGKPNIIADDIFISSPHLEGTVNATYLMNGIKGGHLDLQGKFSRGSAKYAPFYYPTILGKDTMHWLDTSILEGKAEDIRVIVKGDLADFPYVTADNKLDQNLGLFRVTAKISDAILDYGTGWPKIEGLGLNLLFEGKRMELNASKGHLLSNKIIKSKAEIPKLDADDPMLLITGEIDGDVEDGIRFVNQSPVKNVTMGFTDNLKTAGTGKLDLELKVPLMNVDNTLIKGSYKISGGTIFANTDVGLPELTKINGTLNFTEKSLSANNVNCETLGGLAQFSLNTASDKIIHVNANGHITDSGIRKLVSNPFTESLQGATDWTGSITVKKPLVDMSIRSNLQGLAIQLPAPIGKTAMQVANFSIDKRQQNSTEDSVDITYNNVVNAKIIRTEKSGQLAFDRGDIAINTPAERPNEAGLSLHGKLDYVDADEWIGILGKSGNKPSGSPISVSRADFSIQKMDAFNRKLNAVKVLAKPVDSGLKMTIDSQEINGEAEWQSPKNGAENGKIIARLKNLTIPASDATVANSKNEIKKLSTKYPALDVTADYFQIGNKQLGSLELNAYESNEDWIIQKLKISSPDSTLLADGTWHNWNRYPNTSLKFTLSADNIGGTLKRFGQPDMIKDGKAEISGQLRWPGSPHEFEPGNLNGSFKLEASKGQILKAQPGVGRLLGLLSLQSLPRRLTLDFKDLFSEGFAFDKITANARIDSGIMRSDDFFMTGPAAEAKIRGETNLQKETQNLRVKVIPHVSDTLSLAALAGGPIAGAAAFVAQKILKDPFNKVAQSEYVISGTWDNPQEVNSEKKN